MQLVITLTDGFNVASFMFDSLDVKYVSTVRHSQGKHCHAIPSIHNRGRRREAAQVPCSSSGNVNLAFLLPAISFQSFQMFSRGLKCFLQDCKAEKDKSDKRWKKGLNSKHVLNI